MKRLFFAETFGTASLLAVVIGSGIMGEQLAGGNVAVALLVNTIATVFGLYVLITTLGSVSGAHFNPVVSLVMCLRGQLSKRHTLLYWCAQSIGAVLGAMLAHAMFDLPIGQVSHHVRDGLSLFVSEIIATAGLLFVILRFPSSQVAAGVACYIGAAYLFTASTSFANPAAVLGRMFTDTFSGIAPQSAVMFVVAQVIGALLGWLLAKTLTARHERGERD
ncbi:MIP family protein [Formosimonas limnophila]|uniref:MIP family protein n=1 Tax=Formosimonas limnophila TaxID=1384487 RepID=A0A8J3CMD1_9BURK|nr:MIP/aquaporin family protein [Formosimonas limnophila]GHA69865.1 MIP family protein [Formosimonas limnophila]